MNKDYVIYVRLDLFCGKAQKIIRKLATLTSQSCATSAGITLVRGSPFVPLNQLASQTGCELHL